MKAISIPYSTRFSFCTFTFLVLAATAVHAADQYTDQQVTDGILQVLKENPGMTEGDVRKKAMDEFGITDAQLDRVKQQYEQANGITPPRAPTPDKWDDKTVLNGVDELIRASGGTLTEADVRQKAMNEYGITDTQLDRVRELYVARQNAQTAQPAPIAPVTLDRYDDATVTAGLATLRAQNPDMSDSAIRNIAMTQYGVSSTQLDRVGGLGGGRTGNNVASTGVSSECDDYCATATGGGDALCQQVAAIASISNMGGGGLQVSTGYQANGNGTGMADAVAARNAQDQLDQARSLQQLVTRNNNAANRTTRGQMTR